MSLLSYTSDEMYSSTELIRKGKNIFDKLNKHDIQKAVILRDGKPSFILLDFETYEKIIKEYLALKEKNKSVQKVSHETIENKNELKKQEEKELRDIDSVELEKALEEIDKLEFNLDFKEENTTQPLKDFWE